MKASRMVGANKTESGQYSDCERKKGPTRKHNFIGNALLCQVIWCFLKANHCIKPIPPMEGRDSL